MTSKNVVVTIQPENGVSPVAKCVQLASHYKSSIYFENGSRKVNAKSIMGMMAFGVVPGDDIVLHADGDDEVEAIKEIESFLRPVEV